MIKQGVDVKGLKPEMVLAFCIVQQEMYMGGNQAVITSALDGKHSKNSLHYSGNAIDIRTRDVEESEREPLRACLANILGNQYDVVLEKDHIHIEFDPK